MKAEIIKEENAEEEIRKIGVMDASLPIMLPKCKHRLIKLYEIRNAIANIIKQEMLALGGDAAVNKGTVGCKVEETDVLLMGTLKQYRLVIEKLKQNVSECPEIAEVIKQTLSREDL